MRQTIYVLLVLALFIVGPTDAQDMKENSLGIDHDALPVAVDGWDGVQNGVYQDGRVYIAGQPDEAAFKRFQDLGVNVVINLRPPREMDNRERVPFDEAAVLEELDLQYVQIPLGGEAYPYNRQAVDQFAEVLAKHNGPILLHCTVAWRASYMWAAYLILHHDFTLEDALARGEAIAISPPPLEGLLGKDLTLSYAE